MSILLFATKHHMLEECRYLVNV